MAGQLFAIFGTDEGQVSEAASKRYEELKPAGSDDFAHDLIEGAADNSEGAYQICMRTIEGLLTLPFFGGNKVVWLKDANFLGDDRTGGSERAKEGVEKLLEILKSGLGDDVTFLLSASVIDKRRGFYKFINKEAQSLIFDRIDISKDGWEEEVANLTLKKAKELDLTFSHEALEVFVQLAGEDTRQINSELEKISIYLGPEQREAQVQDIELLVPLSRKGIIWEIGRAIETKQGARAISLIDQQLEKGESAIGLIRAAIIPTVRNLFHARLLLDAAPNIPTGRYDYKKFQGAIDRLPPTIHSALPRKKDGNINAWGLFSAVQKVSPFSSTQLKRGLESCLKADLSLVTTSLDHRFLLHRLVAGIVATH